MDLRRTESEGPEEWRIHDQLNYEGHEGVEESVSKGQVEEPTKKEGQSTEGRLLDGQGSFLNARHGDVQHPADVEVQGLVRDFQVPVGAQDDGPAHVFVLGGQRRLQHRQVQLVHNVGRPPSRIPQVVQMAEIVSILDPQDPAQTAP